MTWYKSPKFWSFVGGIGAAAAGTVVCKAKKTRELAVCVVSKGMQIQQKASEGVQSIKDDAEDLAEEARRKAAIDAEPTSVPRSMPASSDRSRPRWQLRTRPLPPRLQPKRPLPRRNPSRTGRFLR